MASLDFETEKAAFREYFNDNVEMHHDAEDFFRSLISSLLSPVPGLEKPMVTSRVKDREESIRKFSLKYQTTLEQAQQPYSIKDYITDLIGIRIVCLYESEVSLVVHTLRTNFAVLEESDKIKKLESTENTFGYKGFHLDLRINEARKQFPEYARFADLRFEVQVRTIIQDAWSVLDHKIKYKKSIPADLKRRVNTLAALFELADHEFLNIRQETLQLVTKAEAEAEATPLAPSTEATPIPAKPLDAFSFLTLARHHFPGYDFFTSASDGFVQELLGLTPDLTAEALIEVLAKHLSTVREYRQQSFHTLNPYTQIRHSLYMADPKTYKSLLFDMQRANFDEWLRGKNIDCATKR